LWQSAAVTGEDKSATIADHDQFSSVLSLDYSDSADQQNRTIQKLTYLTIGYLPLGLIAVSEPKTSA